MFAGHGVQDEEREPERGCLWNVIDFYHNSSHRNS